MVIPFQVLMIPLVSLYGGIFGVLNSRVTLILMHIGFSLSMATFMFHGAIHTNIPLELEEAALIDGCSRWKTFWRVVFPLLKPTILLTTITSTNGTLQLFDESVNLTNGGPGKSTMTMSHYIYNTSFVQSPNFGYAAAMSILILIMVAILAILQMKVGDER